MQHKTFFSMDGIGAMRPLLLAALPRFVRTLLLLCIVGIGAALAIPSHPLHAEASEAAACGVELSIIAAPFATVDSNKPGAEGPQAAMLAARITNQSGGDLANVQVHIGDGLTPGQFPASAGGSLALLDPTDATHLLLTLKAGESVTSYWPVTYPPTFDVSYDYAVWVTMPSGCTAAQSSQITTRREISASANKLLPNGSFMLITPETVAPGGQISVQITGFTLGNTGQGSRKLDFADAWLQPLGNLDFDPSCLRLIRSEAKINSLSSTPFVDRLYFDDLKMYAANPADTVRYTFLALRECSTSIRPYQQASSGAQEKYNGDYNTGANRIVIRSVGKSKLTSELSVDRTNVAPGELISMKGHFSSSGEPIGYPQNDSPVVITAEIPQGTSYVESGEDLSGSVVVQYSDDGQRTWRDLPPADLRKITHVRWLLKEQLGKDGMTIKCRVRVNVDYNGGSLSLSVSVGLLNSSDLLTDTLPIGGNPTPTPTPTPTATPPSDEVQSGSQGGLESGPVDFDPADLIGLIGEDGADVQSADTQKTLPHKARLLSLMSLRLDDLMPAQGPAGTTSQPVMPADVLAITSAPDAKAVDFVDAEGKIKAVALGVLSVGAPYEHDYAVCNRFKGFAVESIAPFSVDGRWFWHSRSTNAAGMAEEALLFHIFVDETSKHLHVDSRWVRDGYPAQLPFAFDYVFNMQVWSGNLSTSADLLRTILDHLRAVDGGKWQVIFHNDAQPAAPQVYLRQAEVEADRLRVTLVNLADDAQPVEIYGSWRSYLDHEATTPLTLNLMAPPGETNLSLSLPALLDVTLYTRAGGFVDKIYSGGGLWFALPNADGVAGEVSQGQCRPLDGIDPRDLFLAGCVDFASPAGEAADGAGVGRTLNPNGRPVDVSPYRALRFWAKGDGSPVRIRLTTVSVSDGDAYQLVFTPDTEWRQYILPLADFRQQGFGAPVAWTGSDVTAVIWSNAAAAHGPIALAVDGISFTNAGLIQTRSLPVDGADQAPRRVVVDALAGAQIQSATLYVSLDNGESFAAIPMLVNGAALAGDLPAAPLGSEVIYYIEAVDANGYISRAPVDAPVSFFRYRVEDRPGLLVDDFSAAALQNRLGGSAGIFHNEEAGGLLRVYRRGGILRFEYDVSQAHQFAGYFTQLGGLDVSAFTALNLRVRGIAGGEQILVGLRDGAGFEPKVSVGAHLSGGVSQDWRWVQIPLAAFNPALDQQDLHSLSFTVLHGAGLNTGQIEIDEIRFGSGPVLFVVDTFDGGNPQLNAGGGAVWSTAPGATLSATLEPHLAIGQQDFSPAGQALRLDYTVNTGGYALWQTALRGAPSTGSLTFWAKGNSEIAPHLYLGDGERRARVALSDFVQLGPDWQWVSIPLEIFAAQGIDLTRLTTLDVVFEFATGQGVLWLDNIAMGPHGGLAVDQRTLYLRDGGERRVALRSSSGARWQATSDQPWLLAPGSGHGSADLRVRAVNWGLAPGEYRGAVTIINDAGASETIVVNLTVTVDGPPLHRVFMPAIQR